MTLTKHEKNIEPSISVVLITRNRLEELFNCLNSLSHQTVGDFEIVLVDNGSTDGTPKSIERKYPNVRLIRLPYNEGVPGARNIGAINAKGQVLFFLDDDATIDKDALELIIKRFNQEPSLSIIACNLVDKGKNPLIDVKYDKEYHAANFTGAGFVIRKKILQELGYFPKSFFYGAEETDLSLRIYDAGYYIKFCPEIYIYHKPSPSERFSWRRIYYCTRNNIWVAWKYLPFWNAIKNNINNIIIHFKISLGNHQTIYYIKGVWHGILGIPKILKERKPINKHAQRKIKRLLKGLNSNGS